jgi:hypothetical protein
MKILGHVANGVVVLDGQARLPEGASVTITCDVSAKPARRKHRVVLPLVKSDRPGSLPVTSERIARVLQQEDAANYGRFFKHPKS